MTRELQLVIRDDFDGSPEATTITFAFRGTAYEIDLSDKRLTDFELALAPYIARSRKPEEPGSNGSRTGGNKRRTRELAKIREWARELHLQGQPGYDLKPNGVIPKDVHRAYNRAHINAQIPLAEELTQT